MNVWLGAAFGAALCLIPCAAMCLRGTPERRLVGLELTGMVATIVLVLLTFGFGRPILMDLPLTFAVVSLGASLVFVRFLERHL